MTHDELFELGSSYDEMLDQGISLSGESKDYFIDGRIDHLPAVCAAWATRRSHRCWISRVAWATRPPAWPPRSTVLGCSVSTSPRAPSRKPAAASRTSGEFGLLDAVSDDDKFDLCYVNGAYHHIPPGNAWT